MEANLLMISEYTALETGSWLVSFVQYLATGAGALIAGGVGAILYENFVLMLSGTHHTEAAELQGFGPAKEARS